MGQKLIKSKEVMLNSSQSNEIKTETNETEENEDSSEYIIKDCNFWLKRIEDVELFMHNATDHTQLDDVESFLQTVPAEVTLYDVDEGLYPEPPVLEDAEAIQILNEWTPDKGRDAIKDINEQLERRLKSLEASKAPRIKRVEEELQEFTMAKKFYEECLEDPEHAKDKKMGEIKHSNELPKYLLDPDEQDDEDMVRQSLQLIDGKLGDLKEEEQRLKQNRDVRTDDCAKLHEYYLALLRLMPMKRPSKHKKSKFLSIQNKQTNKKKNAHYITYTCT
ncbi:hypothetical protein RFI_05517 [Reticulomyxa filosa]|uniref:Uncharacterized protein n=1 Tax=Reticulomyxa filosa TaxID=46433 RepID=X6P218_RETFI|nr:hypothetical protein RFI_05517 [Reticulomyxa filosa]|eukprot:ETO31602.1 hypothetical protein RFI_05517 [Reticulomyxa filosa]